MIKIETANYDTK